MTRHVRTQITKTIPSAKEPKKQRLPYHPPRLGFISVLKPRRPFDISAPPPRRKNRRRAGAPSRPSGPFAIARADSGCVSHGLNPLAANTSRNRIFEDTRRSAAIVLCLLIPRSRHQGFLVLGFG